ncbi:GNAT family N-acetyltransferase [Metabacillus sp. GX 13764]|uniref:GNAT family N-acetyltransferase n=1 Tax=Metabacillus kandeliae TaxID=2900151 RepID=UPI001E52E51C|nr:GNAT family protein [Metabacillus kandeliae]MCD7034538.1 GNAT family N-acetyltransferase [Metabacillus kandeliae]
MEIDLKDGKLVMIREAEKKDAEQIIEFYNKVGGETDFLSFGKDEFQKDAEEYSRSIEEAHLADNSIMLLALLDNKIISIATIHSSQKPRNRHVGTLGIVISKEFTGLGLGRILMERLIEWTKQNGVTKRISLVTREDNIPAIALYKKLGFQEEGLIIGDTYINGIYYNTLLMGLSFDSIKHT